MVTYRKLGSQRRSSRDAPNRVNMYVFVYIDIDIVRYKDRWIAIYIYCGRGTAGRISSLWNS